MSDPRWDDPRDRDEDARDIDTHWIELGAGPSDPRDDDPRDRDEDVRERDRDSRDRDPRDVFLDGLELPRGLDREVVIDGDHRYELNGEDSRSLAAVGAFRVIAERDLRDPRDESSDPREPELPRQYLQLTPLVGRSDGVEKALGEGDNLATA
jgi:hypothetical protein